MIRYQIDETLKPCSEGATPLVQVLSHKEAAQLDWPRAVHLRMDEAVRLCKAERAGNCIIGSFCLPSHAMGRSQSGFRFVLEEARVTFLDDSGTVQERLRTLAETKTMAACTVGAFFAEFLDSLIQGDIAFLTELEAQLEKLEDSILEKGASENFNHTISRYRLKVMRFAHFYLQLSDVGSVLESCDSFSEKEQRSFAVFAARVDRLYEEAQMLRDYALQIRELYQAQIDVHQNEIMKILTIVTTIFLPLSLIAGWYGMNFQSMPELAWPMGYPLVIAVSIVIVVLCIWLFRRKKFW